MQVTRNILESAIPSSSRSGQNGQLEKIMASLGRILADPLSKREERKRAGNHNGLVRLDKVMDMSKTGVMSNTIAFTEGVDLESINKGKWVWL